MKFNYIPLAFSLAVGVLATDPYGAPMPQTTSVKPMPTMPNMAPPAMTHPTTTPMGMTQMHHMSDMARTTHHTTKVLTVEEIVIIEEVKQCHRMTQLEVIIIIVNNSTMMDEQQKKNGWTEEQVQNIMKSAPNATMELSQMRSNATFLAECAHLELIHECKHMHKLEILVLVIANETLIVQFEQVHNLTVVEVTQLKANLPSYQAEVNMLHSNASLVNECKMLEMMHSSSLMMATATKTMMPTGSMIKATTAPTISIKVGNATTARTTMVATTAKTTAKTTTQALAATIVGTGGMKFNTTMTGGVLRQTTNAAPGLAVGVPNWALLVTNGIFVGLLGSVACLFVL